MAKGDSGGGSRLAQMGQKMGMPDRSGGMTAGMMGRQPQNPMYDQGEGKPLGFQHLIQPQYASDPSPAISQQPDQQMPQKSMFQNMQNAGNMASNIGMLMGNRFGQQNQGQDQFQAKGQGGFNVGPNRGINPGGRFGGGMGIFGGGFGGGRRMFGL